MTNKSKQNETQQEFKVPPAFKFQEGEKVLCFHGPLIYEAKCLQARYDDDDKTNQYHIHYSGWNKSWDEWVPESRVLKHNDGNILRQKELHKAQKAEPKGKKGKKRSITGKEKEGELKEKDADDSRSSTPVNEKGGGGGKASASATQSSSQESASDIPKRKRSKLDPSVETSEGTSDDSKKPTMSTNFWKVNFSSRGSPKKSPIQSSPVKSPKKINSTKAKNSYRTKKSNATPQIETLKENSPAKLKSPKKTSTLRRRTLEKNLSPRLKSCKMASSPELRLKMTTSSPKLEPPVTTLEPPDTTLEPPDTTSSPELEPPKVTSSPNNNNNSLPNAKSSPKSKSPRKKVPLTPTKLYPVLKGRKIQVRLSKLDMNSFDEKTGRLTPERVVAAPVSNGVVGDHIAVFGRFVTEKLRAMKNKAAVKARIKAIEKLLNEPDG